MYDVNENISSFKKANIIRTNLLLSINKELISQEKHNKNNNFLINSKRTQTYCNGFENYVIVERDIITCSEKDYKRLKEKNELPIFLFNLNIQEESPIIIKTNKMIIAKNPKLKRGSSTKSILNEKNEDIIQSNIKNLRLFCNLLKSKNKVEETVVNNRNKSQITRRKKYIKIKSSNNLSYINKLSERKQYKNYINYDEKIIILHKMTKKKDKKPNKKYSSQNFLTTIKENYLNYSKSKKIIDDTIYF